MLTFQKRYKNSLNTRRLKLRNGPDDKSSKKLWKLEELATKEGEKKKQQTKTRELYPGI